MSQTLPLESSLAYLASRPSSYSVSPSSATYASSLFSLYHLVSVCFQMDFLLFVFLSALIPFAYSQRPDNDGNDIDNDQDLDINAFGNVITPIKGNKLIKKNNDNKIFHIYLGEYEDEMLIVSDSMPETMGNLIGLAGLGSNIEMSSSVTCINQEVIIK